MKIKQGEWIIEIALYVGYLLVVIIPPFLYIWTPIETADYLQKQYSRNWNNGYITDIKLITNSICESGYELKTLGYWSGVKSKSCLCKNKLNANIQFSTEDFNYCNKRDVTLLYNCIEIPFSEPVQLTQYKKIEFCIKRIAHSMDDLDKYLKDGQNTIQQSDYVNYFNTLLNKKLTISNEAIVDIIIDKTPSHLDIGNIALTPQLDGYYMHIKKYTSSDNSNVYIYNDLITDIHLFNELRCSYIDMSNFTPNEPKETVEYINYGGNKYCEEFSDSKFNISKHTLSFNDKNKRTVIINKDYLTDTAFSLNDIYSGTKVETYYTTNNIGNDNHLNPDSNYLPVLVYQRYLYGLGCPMIKSMKWHLQKYDQMVLCKNLVIAIAFFNIGAFVMGIVFLIIKLFNNLVGYNCAYCFLTFLFMFMISVALILIITYIILIALCINYFKSFSFYCQIDYRGTANENISKTSPMELQFISDMEFAFSIAIGLLVIKLITIIIHSGYYIIVCGDHLPFIEYMKYSQTQNQIEMEKIK